MKNKSCTSRKSLLNKQHEDIKSTTQLQTIFHYLQNNVATASMVADATGIPQKNITRYKRDLEKAGKLWETVKKLCEKTKFKAFYITCNPEYAPKGSNQLSLF
jgi:predicted transcriptional regulator